MKKHKVLKYSAFVVGFLIIAGLIYAILPKNMTFFLKDPDQVTSCDIICDKFYSSQTVTLSPEEIDVLLNQLESHSVHYAGQYDFIVRPDHVWIYRMIFWNGNEQLGAICIDQSSIYKGSACYKILGPDPSSISSYLYGYFIDKEAVPQP